MSGAMDETVILCWMSDAMGETTMRERQCVTHYDFVGRCNRCFKFSERSVNFTERLVVRSLKDPGPRGAVH